MDGTQTELNNISARKDPDRIPDIIGTVVAIISVIMILSLSFSVPGISNSLPANINRSLVYQKYKEGVFILDVRDPEEWAESHIPGSTLIPLDELESRTGEIPFDQEIIVICSHSIRSRTGRDLLLGAGHTRVSSIIGGLIGWNAAGYPIVTGG